MNLTARFTLVKTDRGTNMRITMIHAIPESIPPVRLAFGEEFPEAEVINVMDEGLLIDFIDQITPQLRRRMSNLIGYCQDNHADAIGLACFDLERDEADAALLIPRAREAGTVARAD